jgi:hypothetical protein
LKYPSHGKDPVARETRKFIQEKEAERARKRILFDFSGYQLSPDKIFRLISKLIKIPTIMMLLPEEVVQIMNSEKKLIVQKKMKFKIQR